MQDSGVRARVNQSRIPCAILRGGTSKGVFFHEGDLPRDPQARDRVLLAAMGSPDPRQIDGLGGADNLTSKIVIVGPSTRADADVDYTFGQVGIDLPYVSYTANCGNLSAAVGAFAIEEGLVPTVAPVTRVPSTIPTRASCSSPTCRWRMARRPSRVSARLPAYPVPPRRLC